MLRRFFTSSAAHISVQQRVRTQLSLLSNASRSPDARIVFVPRSTAAEDLQSSLPFPVSAAALRDFKAKPQEKLYLYPSKDDDVYKNQRLLLVGLGDAEKVSPTILRDATHGALSMLKSKHVKSAVIQVPTLKGCSLNTARVVELLSQASMLSNYQFDQYMADATDSYGDTELRLPLEQIYLDTSDEFEKNMTEQAIVGEETIFARNLGNERSHIVDPAFMEKVARASTDLPNISVRVLQENDLKKEGITFDTGGLNLKPTGSIEDMHMDMCGSAAVLGAVRAASRQNLKVNIICALALAENAIGSKAVKPLTIVKSHKGITVENNNTDAEGRLVLGDAMSYIQKEYKPNKIIDVATLTGACMIALGEHCAGLFSNSDDLAHKLEKAGTECHERCWRLPILPEHTAALKGSQSDSRSTGRSRHGGACTAAAFLQQFVYEGVDWAHLDIAGPSNYNAAKSYFPKGATGFGVQLLYTYLKDLEQQ
ncbi:cytosol aminopeptidase [Plasmopara halstedii]|uniref:Cytosol aminopeptidase n=1 Tax=Plasmopara halstedii TaxID=4781 RepID=A0A0P1ATG6_PLAHL|nr:cytosol aminopeptidase [Plasmopara halstedii]CEG44768.1 cytosol aminopeptidase [Plasmopara halstedii]|eukprot:XP_024581137.1 cytosol aminopeptidase [Plasmopara halstedii]